MKKFISTDEVLDFAIRSEQEASDFYEKLADANSDLVVKNLFLENAREEKGHKAKLEKVKRDGVFKEEFTGGIPDLKISDYTVTKAPSEVSDYADALRLAIHREKGAFKLYTKLSETTNNLDLKRLFMRLAEEEARHKLRFEMEYDDFVLREN